MKRWLISSTLVLVVGLFGYRLWQQLPSDEAAAAPRGASGRSISTTTAQLGPVTESVTLVGALRAQERVDVTPRVAGRVVGILVDLGDYVRANQLIARLEDDEVQQQVQQSEAALEVSRAVVQQRGLELQYEASTLERTKGLHDNGLISADQLAELQTRHDVAKAQENLARAQLLQSEAGLRELRLRLDQTHVLAPIAGYVGRRFVDPGARVNSSTPIVTLIELDTVELIAAVAEQDLVKVQSGAAGAVFVDALPGERFEGTVARISPLLDPQTRTAQVEIVIPNPDHRLKAQMFARVDLTLASKREALRIPRQSLVVRGDRQGVFVVEDNIVTFREIGTGLAEDDWVEVASGLAIGDTIAALGANLLRDGDKVRVADASSTPQESSA